MKKIKIFESKVNEGVIGTKWSIRSGTNQAMSNFAFNLSEQMREDKFPQLENTGARSKELAMDIVLMGAQDNGKSVADTLNNSGIGYRNWKVESDNGSVIEIKSIDSSGNVYSIILTKKSSVNEEVTDKSK